MKQAMIFAAGLGTRLKPLTDTMPKALVPVAGEPLLHHQILKMKEAGFERVVINVHHFADQIVSYLEANQNFGLDIRISDERKRLLDTGGGLKKARPLFDADSPVLVHNVDILSNADLSAFYEEAVQKRNPMPGAVLLVSPRKTRRNLCFSGKELVGWVDTQTNCVKGQIADRWGAVPPGADLYAFSGIHVCHPVALRDFDRMPECFSIIDYYVGYASTFVLGSIKNDLRLMDVGKHDTLEQAAAFLQEISRQS